MRNSLLSLAAVALLATACGGSAGATTGPYGGAPAASSGGNSGDGGGAAATAAAVDPGHHEQPPAWEQPQATQPGGVTFQDPGTNPWVDPSEDGNSTFALDVDTASYTIAQSYVHDGIAPDPASVRVEEWVNAFAQGYPEPDESAFAIVADGGPTPFTDDNEQLLRIGLQARSVSDRQRQQASLTFVIDTSGSMEGGGRLELVKDAMRILVRNLDGNDRVSIVTFGSDAVVVLGPTPANHSAEILDAIDRLQPGGSTNLAAGLRLGYQLARETLTENQIDRIVLASDGVANVGLVDADSILAQIKRDAAAGIEMVSVGVGMGNYNDALLEQLADQGDGFYAYVNSREEARDLFSERLTTTLETVALDAKAQVSFDRETVSAYRLLGYENRAVADNDFRNDEVEAGAINAGHSVTALYAIQLQPGFRREGHIADVHLRWTDPERKEPAELRRAISLDDLSGSFSQTDPHFRFDAIVATTAELYRGSEMSGRLSLRDVADIAEREASRLPQTDEVHAFLELLDGLQRFR